MTKLSNKTLIITLIISSIVMIIIVIGLTIIKNDYKVVESNPNIRDEIANRIINDRGLAEKSRKHRKEEKASRKYFKSFKEKDRKTEAKRALAEMDKYKKRDLYQKMFVGEEPQQWEKEQNFGNFPPTKIQYFAVLFQHWINTNEYNYNIFIKNKDDMASNRRLYDRFLKEHKKYIAERDVHGVRTYNENYKYHKLLKIYYKIPNASAYNKHVRTAIIELKEYLKPIDLLIKKSKEQAEEIYKYSINYEEEFFKRKNIKKECDNTFEEDLKLGAETDTVLLKQDCLYDLSGTLKVSGVADNINYSQLGTDTTVKLEGISTILVRHDKNSTPVLIYTRQDLIVNQLFGKGKLRSFGTSYISELDNQKLMIFLHVPENFFYKFPNKKEN